MCQNTLHLFEPPLPAANMLPLPTLLLLLSSLLFNLPQLWNSGRFPPKPPCTEPYFPHAPQAALKCNILSAGRNAALLLKHLTILSVKASCISLWGIPLCAPSSPILPPLPSHQPEPCWNSHFPYGAKRTQSSLSVYTSQRAEFPAQHHTCHQQPRQGEAVLPVCNTAPHQTAGGMFSFPALSLEHHTALSHCRNTILL